MRDPDNQGVQSQPDLSPDEVFLTPRVIDRRAFEHYTSQLRASLHETSRESDLLARRAEAAAVVLERLERFVGSHSDVFDRASRLIESIDERQNSTGELLERVTRQTEVATKAVREIEAVATERGEAFEQRLMTLAADALDKFEGAKNDLSGQAAGMRRDLIERLDAIRDQGESVLVELESRAERASASLRSLLDEVEGEREATRSRTRESARELTERAEELREEIKAAGSGIKRELDGAARSLREAIAAGSAHRDTIERAAELAVGRAMSGISDQTLELERLARRAETIVRDHRSTIESLEREMEARSSSLVDSFEAAVRGALGQKLSEAERVSSELGDSLKTARRLMDEGELERGIREASEARRELRDAAQSLEEAVTRAIADGEEARHSLIRAAEDVRGQSARLTLSAKETADESRPVLEELKKSIAAAGEVVTALDAQSGALDARVETHVAVVMDERTLAMREEIGSLQDRLERSEERERVVREVVERQASDMASMREAIEALQRAQIDQRAEPNDRTVDDAEAEEPEVLVPVVVATSPAARKKTSTTTRKAATKKTQSKKTVSKKTASKKATTKKAAAKKKTAKKSAAKKKTSQKASAKKSAPKAASAEPVVEAAAAGHDEVAKHGVEQTDAQGVTSDHTEVQQAVA